MIVVSTLVAGLGAVAVPAMVLAQDAVFVTTTGDVGVGTSSPSDSLHVARSNGTSGITVTESSSTIAARALLNLENKGNTSLIINDTSASGQSWQLGNLSSSAIDGFVISRQGDGENELIIKDNGDVFIENGTVQVISSRNSKENFESLDPEAVLASLGKLPITAWSYKKDAGAVRHIGPVAEDFRAAFGLGPDDKHVSHGDTSGVALAAIQGLLARLEELEKENAALARRLEQLEERTP